MMQRTSTPEGLRYKNVGAFWNASFIAFSLLLAFVAPVQSQEPPSSSDVPIAEAARNAREQKISSAKPVKVVTNDELGEPSSSPSAGAPSASANAPATSESPAKPKETAPPAGACPNPNEENLKSELQAAQQEREQLRRELSPQAPVISGGNLDTSNFKPGNSGFNLGSPPLSQSQPQSPARLAEVALDEKIKALEQALASACDAPKAAAIRRNLDAAVQQLNLSQRQFDLDRAAFYSQSNYAGDAAGKARLDAEQQEIQALRSEVERLKDQLAAEKGDQSAR